METNANSSTAGAIATIDAPKRALVVADIGLLICFSFVGGSKHGDTGREPDVTGRGDILATRMQPTRGQLCQSAPRWPVPIGRGPARVGELATANFVECPKGEVHAGVKVCIAPPR